MQASNAVSKSRTDLIRARQRTWTALGIIVSAAIIAAGLALVFVLWTGVGAPFDGTVGRVRLPWSSADLAPLPAPPGTAELAAEALRLRAPDSLWSFDSWPTTFWSIVLVLVAAAALATWRVEQRGSALGGLARHTSWALAAPVLYIGGGLWLSWATHHHAVDGAFGPPDYIAWRSVPGFVAPAVGLFVAAVAVSLVGLVTIARSRRAARQTGQRGARRTGLVFATCSLVLSLWALMCVDRVFLAPDHVQPRVGMPELALPVAFHARHWRTDPEERPLRIELWLAEGEVHCAIALERSPRELHAGVEFPAWRGKLDSQGWRAVLTESVNAMPRLPLSPPSTLSDGAESTGGPTAPDQAVLLAIDRTLVFGDVRPMLEAVEALGVWKVGIVAAGPGTPGSCFVLMRYLPRMGSGEVSKSHLELVLLDPAGPAGLRMVEHEWPNVYRFLDSAVGRESPRPRLVVDDRLTWAAFVQVHDALDGAGVLDSGLAPGR